MRFWTLTILAPHGPQVELALDHLHWSSDIPSGNELTMSRPLTARRVPSSVFPSREVNQAVTLGDDVGRIVEQRAAMNGTSQHQRARL